LSEISRNNEKGGCGRLFFRLRFCCAGDSLADGAELSLFCVPVHGSHPGVNYFARHGRRAR